jgi:hypothetical protein
MLRPIERREPRGFGGLRQNFVTAGAAITTPVVQVKGK